MGDDTPPPHYNAGPEAPRQAADERRLAFQLALADRLRPLSSSQEIVAAASEMLGRHLDVSRVVYAEIDDAQGSFFIRCEWGQQGIATIAGEVRPLDDFGPEVIGLLRSGRPLVVHNIASDPRTAMHTASYAALGIFANLAVPLVKAGRLVLVLSLHHAQPRPWTEQEVQLVEDVAERTWAAVEAVRAESKLRETQAWMTAMFEILPLGVGVFDATGSLVLANRGMYRYLPQGVLPSRDAARLDRWRIFAPDGREVERTEFPGARALRGETVVPGMEALFTLDDDKAIWTQVAAVPIRGSDGVVTGQVSVVHEIDTLKRAETGLRRSEEKYRSLAGDLAESNRRQSEFLAVLAHELRNPLAPILTGLEIMRRKPDSLETAVRVRDMVERQIRQMAHLVDDLLDIARVTSGKIEIRKRVVDLHVAIAAALEASGPVIEAAGHQLSLQLHEGVLAVSADPTRLAQILGNLLTNAAKYTPRGGQIHLALEKDGDEAIISVADSGIGIPRESLSAVFEMFSQVKRDTDHSAGGLGIGLALVRQLVSLHGGSVSATSDGPGRGSTFIVRLPLEREAAPAADAAQRPPHENGRALRILVADDNVDAAQTLATLLAMYGHQLEVAHDGLHALRAATNSRPDVAFLDIGMPGMTGYEVARQLRAMEPLRHTTLVALTGWGTEDDRGRAREAGFDRHFTKPVSPEDIERFLQELAR